MTAKSQYIKYIAFILTTFSSTVFAAPYDDYLSANGVKIELGQSQRDLESKLGRPTNKSYGMVFWTLKNGNSLATSFDQYGLSSATISGHKPDFLYAQGIKTILGQGTINTVQKKYKYGCYYQGFGEGWIADYIVRSGPEGSWNLTFNTWGDNDKTIKNKKIDSLSIGNDEPFGEQQYCTY